VPDGVQAEEEDQTQEIETDEVAVSINARRKTNGCCEWLFSVAPPVPYRWTRGWQRELLGDTAMG